MSGIRLLIVDDNPYVSWEGRAHPVNATFHRFLAALFDLPDGQVREVVHAVPMRAALGPPHSQPVDSRIRVVGTAPFDGIAGFLRHARSVTVANRGILGPEIEAADLVWLKVPASNAALAARLSARAGTPLFGWVAGSAWRVAAAQDRNPLLKLGAIVVGAAYDGVGRLAGGDRRIVVGRDIVEGDGIVASLVEQSEVRDSASPWAPHQPLRITWAGRVAPGKGLDSLLALLAALPESELVMLGEGPARSLMEKRAARLGVASRIDWRGFVADRGAYLNALAAADIVVHPSPAEGFPKVILDAMAAGAPVAAEPAGGVSELAHARLVAPIRRARRAPADPTASAVMSLLRDPVATQAMRDRATAFASAHTRPAEAARLVARLERWFPELPWR